MPRSRYSMKLRRPVLYTAPSARFTLKRCFASLMVDPPFDLAAEGLPRRDDLARLDIDHVSPRSHGLHGLEAVLDHVAVELHAVTVGVGEVHARSEERRVGKGCSSWRVRG